MRLWHRVLFMFSLALLPTACGVPSDGQTLSAQAAEQPNLAERAVPTVPPSVPTRSPTVVATVTAGATDEPHDSCPVTRPPSPLFVPPAPYSRYVPAPDEFWYGADGLWTAVPKNGLWSSLPHNSDGYTQKVFWWRKGYSWTAEPEPRLTVTGRRLDTLAPPLNVSRATNAFAADFGSAMLVGVDFPTLGCWEITGHYADAELTFVIQVVP